MSRKRILVTGGSRGIGKALVNLLQVDPQWEVLAPPREELDLLSCESIRQYTRNCGRIDALANVAGVNILSCIDGVSEDNIRLMEQTNLNAPLLLIQGLVARMRENGGGKIVNFSSIWGLRSKELRTLYSITKFGIIGLTRALSRELGPYGILVNAISPGYVLTDMTRKNVPPDEQAKICNDIPLRRMANPEEIAKVVRFLVSDDNTYITGSTILIDGGYLA